MKLEEIEHLLDTYTLEEIIEYNDLTEADVLFFLVRHRFLELPEIKPLEF